MANKKESLRAAADAVADLIEGAKMTFDSMPPDGNELVFRHHAAIGACIEQAIIKMDELFGVIGDYEEANHE